MTLNQSYHDLRHSPLRLAEAQVLVAQVLGEAVWRLAEAVIVTVMNVRRIAEVEVLAETGRRSSAGLVELVPEAQNVRPLGVLQVLTVHHLDLLDVIICLVLWAYPLWVYPWELVVIQNLAIHLGQCGWFHFYKYHP